MAGVRDCESRLCEAALAYSRDSSGQDSVDGLKRAAIVYAKAKKKSADSRDRWKQKKRLGE